LYAVKSKAANMGFRIEFVRKVFGPRHVQDRIYLNGRRCQLMTAHRVNPKTHGDGRLAEIRPPANAWAEFLIYVPEPLAQREQPFFIVPRRLLSEGALQTPDQLRQYAEGWHFLKHNEKERTAYSGEEQAIRAEPANRDPQAPDSTIGSSAV